MQIRTAIQNDLKQLLIIYNQAITDGNCTADIKPLTMAERQEWFAGHSSDKYPIFVMNTEETDTITGWCSLSAHRKGRMALANVAEISYYVGREYRGKGIGSCLIQHALREAPKLGFHNLLPFCLISIR